MVKKWSNGGPDLGQPPAKRAGQKHAGQNARVESALVNLLAKRGDGRLSWWAHKYHSESYQGTLILLRGGGGGQRRIWGGGAVVHGWTDEGISG